MKQRILNKVEESFVKAESFYGRKFTRPKNIIFKRSGSTAGHCDYRKSELMFQIGLAEQEQDNFINDTPAHEVAHWIDRELYGFRTTQGGNVIRHGDTWKHIMRYVMNQDPERCHSFDVANFKRARNTFDYVCIRGCKHTLSSVIHNRILKGRKYSCKCGGSLTLKVLTPAERLAKIEASIAALTNSR